LPFASRGSPPTWRGRSQISSIVFPNNTGRSRTRREVLG
jgi:hypothetical protein